MKWIADNATGDILKADPSKGFVLGGVSAGASITGALSRKFQEEPLSHPLTGQWLCIPPLMDKNSAPEKYKSYHISREQNAENPTMPTAAVDTMIQLGNIDLSHELGFAVNSKTPLSGQPKTYFQVAGMDPLRVCCALLSARCMY
jgi:acetyl esterase/lipase